MLEKKKLHMATLWLYIGVGHFLLLLTTAQLYLAISRLPWTLVTLCRDISVALIMPLLTRL